MNIPMLESSRLPELVKPGWYDELPGQPPVLAFDLRGCDEPGLPHIVAALQSQPVPTLALVDAGAGVADSILQAFDLLAESEQALQQLHDAIAANPQASAVCCQVSRMTSNLDIADALVVESLAYATLQAGGEFRRWLASHEPSESLCPSDPVLLAREGDLLKITLNSEGNRNALSTAMRDSLTSAFRLAAMDESISKVSLDARGPAFCAGGDLSEFGSAEDMSQAHQIRLRRMPAAALAAIASKVQCHVHGACIGAGIEMPAFAAEIIAKPDSVFRLPEVQMGLIPGAGGCVSIPRRIGRQTFNALAISGREVSAEEALALHLVDKLN